MLEVSTWEIVQNVRIFKAFFVNFFVYYFVLDRPQFALMKLYNIRDRWTVQIAGTFELIREILTQQLVPRQTSCSTLWLLFLLGAKRITIINAVHFFKKRCLAAFSLRILIIGVPVTSSCSVNRGTPFLWKTL